MLFIIRAISKFRVDSHVGFSVVLKVSD